MSQDGDNVVDFPADPEAMELGVGPWRFREQKCKHVFVELSEAHGNRRVYCRDCDETLDAFEVLMRYARVGDKLRRQDKAWKELNAAWAWLWEEKGAVTISRTGVRASIKINDKRRSRKAHPAHRDGLASLIVGAVQALKDMKRWER